MLGRGISSHCGATTLELYVTGFRRLALSNSYSPLSTKVKCEVQYMEINKIGVRDVAKKAGVSVGTVSNVLNRPEGVTPKIRNKVLRAMKSLEFIPSRAAGQLRNQKSWLVGVMVPDVGNLYWASVLRGIEKVCDDQEMGMVVSSIHQDPKRERRALHELMSQGVDGLILAPIDGLSEELLSFRSRLGIVSIGESPIVPHVGSNGMEGMYDATLHLLRLGHRHIGLINGKDFVSWCAARRDGVIKAMEEWSIDHHEFLHEFTVDDLTVEEGRRGAQALLKSQKSYSITALMCANDMVALGAVLQAKTAGFRLPRDLSIIGYDDVEFASALFPALTTVRQPSYEFGVQAARLLVTGAVDGATPNAPQLIVRDSTGSVPFDI